MVFTSIPVAYLDAANWQQQQPNHQPENNNSTSQQLLPPPPPPPPPPPHGAGGTSSIRLEWIAERTRMANRPKPETALKCPRCESTNTKFCYYNNYCFSQPRYICKACSRYWTKGGTLRDVPVGGGYRKNKRSKGSSSSTAKSLAIVSSGRQTGSASSNSTGGHAAGIIAPQVPPPMMFKAPLHHQFSEFGSGDMVGLNYGLSYSPIFGPMGGGIGNLSFQIGSSLGGGGGGSDNNGGGGGVPQTQQFPFLAGLEGSPVGLYHHPFEGSAHDHHEVISYGSSGDLGVSHLRPNVSTSGLMTQFASAKMEGSRELNNNNPASEQYWSINSAAWTDISDFTSSSTTSNQM